MSRIGVNIIHTLLMPTETLALKLPVLRKVFFFNRSIGFSLHQTIFSGIINENSTFILFSVVSKDSGCDSVDESSKVFPGTILSNTVAFFGLGTKDLLAVLFLHYYRLPRRHVQKFFLPVSNGSCSFCPDIVPCLTTL